MATADNTLPEDHEVSMDPMGGKSSKKTQKRHSCPLRKIMKTPIRPKRVQGGRRSRSSNTILKFFPCVDKAEDEVPIKTVSASYMKFHSSSDLSDNNNRRDSTAIEGSSRPQSSKDSETLQEVWPTNGRTRNTSSSSDESVATEMTDESYGSSQHIQEQNPKLNKASKEVSLRTWENDQSYENQFIPDIPSSNFELTVTGSTKQEDTPPIIPERPESTFSLLNSSPLNLDTSDIIPPPLPVKKLNMLDTEELLSDSPPILGKKPKPRLVKCNPPRSLQFADDVSRCRSLSESLLLQERAKTLFTHTPVRKTPSAPEESRPLLISELKTKDLHQHTQISKRGLQNQDETQRRRSLSDTRTNQNLIKVRITHPDLARSSSTPIQGEVQNTQSLESQKMRTSDFMQGLRTLFKPKKSPKISKQSEQFEYPDKKISSNHEPLHPGISEENNSRPGSHCILPERSESIPSLEGQPCPAKLTALGGRSYQEAEHSEVRCISPKRVSRPCPLPFEIEDNSREIYFTSEDSEHGIATRISQSAEENEFVPVSFPKISIDDYVPMQGSYMSGEEAISHQLAFIRAKMNNLQNLFVNSIGSTTSATCGMKQKSLPLNNYENIKQEIKCIIGHLDESLGSCYLEMKPVEPVEGKQGTGASGLFGGTKPEMCGMTGQSTPEYHYENMTEIKSTTDFQDQAMTSSYVQMKPMEPNQSEFFPGPLYKNTTPVIFSTEYRSLPKYYNKHVPDMIFKNDFQNEGTSGYLEMKPVELIPNKQDKKNNSVNTYGLSMCCTCGIRATEIANNWKKRHSKTPEKYKNYESMHATTYKFNPVVDAFIRGSPKHPMNEENEELLFDEIILLPPPLFQTTDETESEHADSTDLLTPYQNVGVENPGILNTIDHNKYDKTGETEHSEFSQNVSYKNLETIQSLEFQKEIDMLYEYNRYRSPLVTQRNACLMSEFSQEVDHTSEQIFRDRNKQCSEETGDYGYQKVRPGNAANRYPLTTVTNLEYEEEFGDVVNESFNQRKTTSEVYGILPVKRIDPIAIDGTEYIANNYPYSGACRPTLFSKHPKKSTVSTFSLQHDNNSLSSNHRNTFNFNFLTQDNNTKWLAERTLLSKLNKMLPLGAGKIPEISSTDRFFNSLELSFSQQPTQPVYSLNEVEIEQIINSYVEDYQDEQYSCKRKNIPRCISTLEISYLCELIEACMKLSDVFQDIEITSPMMANAFKQLAVECPVLAHRAFPLATIAFQNASCSVYVLNYIVCFIRFTTNEPLSRKEFAYTTKLLRRAFGTVSTVCSLLAHHCSELEYLYITYLGKSGCKLYSHHVKCVMENFNVSFETMENIIVNIAVGFERFKRAIDKIESIYGAKRKSNVMEVISSSEFIKPCEESMAVYREPIPDPEMHGSLSKTLIRLSRGLRKLFRK